MIFLILFLLQAGSLSPENSAIQKEKFKTAVHFCQRAKTEYRGKNFGMADHFLKRCRFNNENYFFSDPDALKVKALLSLKHQDISGFLFFGEKSVQKRNDPFFLYLLAREALRIRKSREAYLFLERLLNASPADLKTYEKDHPGIFFCRISSSWNNEIPFEPHAVSKRDRSLAIFQFLSLSRLNQTTSDPEQMIEKIKTLSDSPKDESLKRLFMDPEKDSSHIRCIRSLEKDLKKIYIKKKIRRKAGDTLLLLYRNRIALIPGERSYYAYGNALLENKNYREALLTYRLILEKSGWNRISDSAFPGQKFSEILRKAGFAYSRIHQKKDSETLYRMADTIDENSHLDPLSADYRIRLLNTARENLKNREALLLLEADANWRKDRKSAKYRDRILKRDREMDDKELHSIFQDSFPF
ncbi:MAG: hypothetical protein OEZ34_03345 [Spirochaetia bacterium]|nr:hypothetical protein [Spirochaetia bacterium]